MQESDIRECRKYITAHYSDAIKIIVTQVSNKQIYFRLDTKSLHHNDIFRYDLNLFLKTFIPCYKYIKATALAKKLHPKAEQEGDFLIVEL